MEGNPMFEMWISHPGLFITLAALLLLIFIAPQVTMLINRPYRHRERMEAIRHHNIQESFFAARLLMYIPWQFWTSLIILAIVILATFLTSGETSKAFMELSKYVTGTVVGSLFQNTLRQSKEGNSPTQGKDEHDQRSA
jgi:hypothetical protein